MGGGGGVSAAARVLPNEQSTSLMSQYHEPQSTTKILLNTSMRQKRSISATLNSTATTTSSGLGTSVSTTTTTTTMGGVATSAGGGILHPHMKQLLYTLHLVYEEAKLYRSLYQQLASLVQILYLLANELNLAHYLSYYESEMPSLIKLKAQHVFANSQFGNLSSSTSSSSSSSSSFSSTSNLHFSSMNKNNLAHLLSQQPPVLSKFLLELMSPGDGTGGSGTGGGDTIPINPFPLIGGVCKRTQRAIKIYAVCALCINPRLAGRLTYEDLMGQLFFRINHHFGANDIPVKTCLYSSSSIIQKRGSQRLREIEP